MRFAMIGCLFLLLPSLLVAQEKGGASEFLREWKQVERMAKREQWKKALRQIEKMLVAHERQVYVNARATEIAEMTKRCVFGSSNKVPEAKDVVSGKLQKYNSRSGSVKISYTKKTAKDWIKQGKTLAHPIRFSGPFTVEIKGDRYPIALEETPEFRFGGEEAYQVLFGSPPKNNGYQQEWLPAAIYRLTSGEPEKLATKEISPGKPGKPYVIKVKVAKTSMTVWCNGTRIGTVKKPKKLFGGIAFSAGEWSEVSFSGKSHCVFIQQRIDHLTQQRYASFHKSYDQRKHLPAWLFESPAVTSSGSSSSGELAEWPADVEPRHYRALNAISSYDQPGSFRRGLNRLAELKDDELPESARLVIAARFHLGLGEAEEALEAARRCVKLQPEYAAGFIALALAASKAGNHSEAVKACERAVALHPKHATVYEVTTTLLMMEGLHAAAKKIMDRALMGGLGSQSLRAVNAVLVKALQGPKWSKIYEWKTLEYHVFSDIDKETCKEAAKILEDARLMYNARLQRVRRGKLERFKVYIFSGKAGYEAYCHDVMGSAPSHTAGLYSPLLKQLLVWNLPDRAQMLRTVRHEGFHQYLDRIMPDPPSWFNEGMAEYYETARFTNGRLTGGQKRSDHLEVLKARGFVPLKTFLYEGPETFYSAAETRYSQGWAMVHFLQHGAKEDKALFDRMMSCCQKSMPAREAVAEAFKGVDLDRLDARFQAYVRSL